MPRPNDATHVAAVTARSGLDITIARSPAHRSSRNRRWPGLSQLVAPCGAAARPAAANATAPAALSPTPRDDASTPDTVPAVSSASGPVGALGPRAWRRVLRAPHRTVLRARRTARSRWGPPQSGFPSLSAYPVVPPVFAGHPARSAFCERSASRCPLSCPSSPGVRWSTPFSGGSRGLPLLREPGGLRLRYGPGSRCLLRRPGSRWHLRGPGGLRATAADGQQQSGRGSRTALTGRHRKIR